LKEALEGVLLFHNAREMIGFDEICAFLAFSRSTLID